MDVNTPNDSLLREEVYNAELVKELKTHAGFKLLMESFRQDYLDSRDLFETLDLNNPEHILKGKKIQFDCWKYKELLSRIDSLIYIGDIALQQVQAMEETS